MKSFESFTLLFGLLLPEFVFFFLKKKPCIKQVFDQDSSPQSLLPPLLLPLDADFICGPLQKQKNEKLITKDECKRPADILIWQRYQVIPSFLDKQLASGVFIFFFFLSVSLSCPSLWLTASAVCLLHILKNVLGVLPPGTYLKLSFLLNLGWSRRSSAKLNMTNRLQIFIRRPSVLLLSCVSLAENVPSCSPPCF